MSLKNSIQQILDKVEIERTKLEGSGIMDEIETAIHKIAKRNGVEIIYADSE